MRTSKQSMDDDSSTEWVHPQKNFKMEIFKLTK